MNYKSRLSRNVLAIYFAIATLFVGLRICSEFGLFSSFGVVGNAILTVVIQIGLMFSSSIFVFSLVQKTSVKNTFKFYGFQKISPMSVIISIAMGIVVYILTVFISYFFNCFLSLIGYHFSESPLPETYPVWLLIVNIVLTAVLPAICEEITHRGMLIKGLSGMGIKKALIISSILFGLLHGNIEQFFYTTMIGFFLGHIAITSESIYPAIIIHFMNNFISVFMGYSQVNKLGLEVMFTKIFGMLTESPILGIMLIFVIIAVLIGLLFLLYNLLLKNTVIKNMRSFHKKLFNLVEREHYIDSLESIAEGKEEDGRIPPNAISADQFARLYNQNHYRKLSEVDLKFSSDYGKHKLSAWSIIFMVATFVLLAGLTIFTLVWGMIW